MLEGGRLLLYVAALVVLIGAVSHVLGWLLTRRRTVRWVWQAWNVLGVVLLVLGLAAIGYGWGALGLKSGPGSALAGVGLLLASAGLWILVPV